MNCTTTSGQLAAAISAPRLRAVFSAGVWGIDSHQFTLCGILLDEWLCPFARRSPRPCARRPRSACSWRRLLAAGLTSRRSSPAWPAPRSSGGGSARTDAAAAARVEQDVRERVRRDDRARSRTRRRRASPAIRRRSALASRARDRTRGRSSTWSQRPGRQRRTPTTSRSRSTTPSTAARAPGRAAVRHPARAHRRTSDAVRHARRRSGCAWFTSADHRRPDGRRSARSPPSTSSRRRRAGVDAC